MGKVMQYHCLLHFEVHAMDFITLYMRQVISIITLERFSYTIFIMLFALKQGEILTL